MSGIAIGLLMREVSGPDAMRDEATIRRMAAQHGYTLNRIIVIDEDTFMPTTFVVSTACSVKADAVIAPDIAHFGYLARAVSVACELITPGMRVPCTNSDRSGARG